MTVPYKDFNHLNTFLRGRPSDDEIKELVAQIVVTASQEQKVLGQAQQIVGGR